MDIQQGNIIDPVKLAQLEIGMTRNQVRFLLGTPAVLDPYVPDEWNYVYYLKPGDQDDFTVRRMSLFFSDDILTDIQGSLINPG